MRGWVKRAVWAGLAVLAACLAGAPCAAQVIQPQPNPLVVYCWNTGTSQWQVLPNASAAMPYGSTPQPIALYGYNASLTQYTPLTATGGTCPLGAPGGGASPVIGVAFSNSGSPLAAATGCTQALSAGPITLFALMGDGTSGNATVDVQTETFAAWLAGTAPASITGGNPLSFSAAKGVQSTTFTGWTSTSVVSGNMYCFVLSSPASILTLTAKLQY